jgi:uncharacterized membrane protein
MCVIIGFGGVFLNGVYGAESKRRRGPEGLAVFEATERVGRIAEFFILAVPVFGIALVLMSHHQWEFSQAWVSASLTIYVAALIVSFGFHLPNLRRMGGLMHELVSMSVPVPVTVGGHEPMPEPDGPPPQALELERRGRMAGIYGGTLNLAIVAVVILMVWKPGT